MCAAFSIKRFIAAAFLLVSLDVQAIAQGDPDMGEKVFKKCAVCHKVGDGAKNGIGPVLTGIVGRKIASFPDYSYGKSMRKVRELDLVWDDERLDQWLSDPREFLRKVLDTRKAKSKMRFKLKKQEDRDHVIAYLKTFSAELKKSGVKDEAMPKISAQPAMAIAPDDVCIENRSKKTLLFVAEVKNGERLLKTLAPGENLCASAKDDNKVGGTVGVFLNIDALEGCSRLASAGAIERLIAYEPFDNCTWAQ